MPRMNPRTVTVTAAAALLTLAATLTTTACSSASKTADCASVAGSITGHVASLEKAVATFGNDPHGAATALRQLQSDIDDIAGKTTNTEMTKAINELATGVANTKDDLDNGVKPNVKPMADAAVAFAKSCLPGSSRQSG